MQFEVWEPVYESICADFGFDRSADERARNELAALVDGEPTLTPHHVLLDPGTVAIAGAGPSLEDDLDIAREADTVVAASTAAGRLADAGVAVDLVVTDLDKHPETVVAGTRAGREVVVHAHGDNTALVDEYLPQCDLSNVLPTTQVEPAGGVYNPGGFTDGDRAAFLADQRGAERLVFPGWDFDDEGVSPVKARKLDWAERLLFWLEHRRGERFDVLDERRETVTTSGLPIESNS